MKTGIPYLMLLLLSLLLLNCEKEENENTIEYSIISGACGTILLSSNIGADYNDALDSLKILRQPLINGGCPNRPCHTSYVEEVKMVIDFSLDNREFLGIIFRDAENNISLFAMSDVLDTLGNHYYINWCPD